VSSSTLLVLMLNWTQPKEKKIENPHFIYTDPNMKRYGFKGLTTTPIPLKQS